MKLYTKIFESEKLTEEIKDGPSLASEIESTIKKYFPKSYVDLEWSTRIIPGITIRFAFGKDKSEWGYGYMSNDPGYHIMSIQGFEKDGSIVNPLEFKVLTGRLSLAPYPGSHLAFKGIKTGFSKKKGTPDQILKHIDGKFKNFKKLVQDNLDNFRPEHQEVVRSKV